MFSCLLGYNMTSSQQGPPQTPRPLIRDQKGSCHNIQYLSQYPGMKPNRLHGLLNIQLKKPHIISVLTNENSLLPHLQHSDTGTGQSKAFHVFSLHIRTMALYLQIQLKTTASNSDGKCYNHISNNDCKEKKNQNH